MLGWVSGYQGEVAGSWGLPTRPGPAQLRPRRQFFTATDVAVALAPDCYPPYLGHNCTYNDKPEMQVGVLQAALSNARTRKGVGEGDKGVKRLFYRSGLF